MDLKEKNDLLVIRKDNDYISEEIRHYIIKKIKFQIFTKFHIITYIIINILLILINNIGYSKPPLPYQWWPWVASGWSLVLCYNLFFLFEIDSTDLTNLHAFTWLIISFYMIFIDYYSDSFLSWAYIPIISWGLIVSLQYLFKREINQVNKKVSMLALLIADDIGRTLISVEQNSNTLKKIMEISNEKLELTAMFLNAIQQFSNEINLRDIKDLNLSAANLKLISINSKDITFTGFFIPETSTKLAKVYLKKISSLFIENFQNEISKFTLAGNSELFEARRKEVEQYLRV